MNKKGFTVIELVVSFTLTAIIAVFLFNLIFSLKDLYTNSVIKTELLNKQTIITQRINKVLSSKKLIALSGCGETKLTFSFDDGTVEKLEIDKANNIIKFGDYTAKLEKNSQFGDIILKTTNVEGVSDDIDDSYLEIKIPITNSLIDEDFGINTIYQYDKEVTSLANIDNDICTVQEYALLLKGLAETVLFTDQTYEEAGYQLSEDGVITDDPSGVTRTGSVGNEEGEYTLTYTYKKNNVTLATATRTVSIIEKTKTFTYNGTTGSDGSTQKFEVKKTGYYQVELWGASGGKYSGTTNGNGGYTSGLILLNNNDQLYVYVGGSGKLSSPSGTGVDVITEGGYNGGGRTGNQKGCCSARYWGSGGGATDIRYFSSTPTAEELEWNNFNSLKSRIMVAAGGGGGYGSNTSTNGGYGGGLSGTNATTANGYGPGYGATQTSGGSGGICASETCVGGAGGFGYGGTRSTIYAAAGGGSGYYGGGSSGHIDAAGGGSSFISGYPGCNAIDSTGTHTGQPNHYSGKIFTQTEMKAGNESMPTYDNSSTMTGNSGNGYAKITYLGNN